jgi:hypothetical protein
MYPPINFITEAVRVRNKQRGVKKDAGPTKELIRSIIILNRNQEACWWSTKSHRAAARSIFFTELVLVWGGGGH